MDVREDSWQERVLDKYYYSRSDWQDGRTQFHQLVRGHTLPSARILEIGAGPTNKTTAFLAELGTVTGLDIDPDVKGNVHCRESQVYDGVHMPFAASQFDLVVSNYVVEHIEDPLAVAREIHRVLCPGGLYIFKTPNLWHYVSLIAKMTPQWVHARLSNRMRNRPQGSHEPYRTYHRMNTRRACSSILKSAGFDMKVLQVIEGQPSYGMSSRFLFYPLMVWERILNSSQVFEDLRANILCVASANK